MFRYGQLRHARFATFGFDLGIYDQAGWLVAFGEPGLITIRGLEVWGHHGTFVFFLLAPGYWLGGGPTWLLFAQVASQASGAIALFLLVRDVCGRGGRWLGVVAGAALLLNPTQQFLVWEYFHPESFAVGPLLFAWWALRTERWRVFAIAAFVAMLCKEDVVLAVAMMGVLIAISSPRSRTTLQIGATTIVVALAWYVAVTRWMIPHYNPGGAFYEQQFFTDFGTSMGEVLWTAVSHPIDTLRFITRDGHLEWYRRMLYPVAGLCLLRPKVMLVAAPMIGVALLADEGHSWVRDARYHYSAIVSAVAVLAAVEALMWIRRRTVDLDGVRQAALVVAMVVVVAALAATRVWGVAPGARDASTRLYWPLQPGESPLDVVLGVDVRADPVAAAKQDAVGAVPAHARVSASYNIDPHLTHRRFVYQFPNPWIGENWAVDGEGQHDPATIQWIVVDRGLIRGTTGSRDEAIRSTLAHLLSDEFEVVRETEGVVLARRVAPPSCIDDPSGMVRAWANPDHYNTSAPPSTGKVCPVT
jgi:uncharacterized membrane protein